MNRWFNLRIGFVVVILGMVLSLGILVGCDDDTPPVVPADTNGQWDTGTTDTVPWPDSTQPDQYVWPDQGADTTIWPDSYSGTPFGCTSDADCFGQLCCKTPWGVKLCMATCQ